MAIIDSCRYGIHDLSRTELDQVNKLPRFNMPFELGIFLGAKRFGNKQQKRKRALVLDIEKYRYQKFISDLAGMDIHEHEGKPEKAAAETRDWLTNVSRRDLPSANKIVNVYRLFMLDFPAICRNLEFNQQTVPYVDFERIVVNWLLEASEN